MDHLRTNPFVVAISTCVAIGVSWGLVDGFATWDRTALFLRPGQILVLIASGVLSGACLALMPGLATVATKRLRTPLHASALTLSVLTLVVALSRLVREPVLGQDVQLLPGGVYTAVALSFCLAALPLVGLLILPPVRRALAGNLCAVWALVLLLVTWFTPGATSALRPATPAPAEAPNLVLVTLDTFRADHVGALGAEGNPTPNLDALADRGVLFSRAYSQIPITGPSHLSILSGTYPWTHETMANGVAVPPGVPVLPELMGRAGYRTAAFVSAFVLDGVFGYGRGFEVYDDAFIQPKGVYDLSLARVWEQVWVRFGSISDVERRGDVTVGDAVAWLGTVEADERFFLWVHLFDAHGPYDPPPPFDSMYYSGDPSNPGNTTLAQATDIAEYMLPSLQGITDIGWPLAQYRGEIGFADQQLGRLLDALAARDVQDDTIIVVVADHGESLVEHGYYFNHGTQLYNPSTHVPLVIVAPDRISPRTEVAHLVENVDLLPTILGLMDLEVPDGLQGKDLGPLIDGSSSGDDLVYTICFDREANRATGEFMRYRRLGVRTGDISFIYREEGAEEYYDLASDPGERTNLAPLAIHGGLVQGLSVEAEGILGSAGTGASERSSGELGAGVRERLKDLGYIEDDDSEGKEQ